MTVRIKNPTELFPVVFPIQANDLMFLYQNQKIRKLNYSDLVDEVTAQIGNGADGREVQLQNNGTFIQWRFTGDVSWTNLLQISTLAGTNGVDGKSLLNGSGVPSNSLGTNGDFYIDNASHYIFGPKAAGIWPPGVDLRGAAGQDGIIGADGASAYEIALANGFVGTESEWLASLQGSGSGASITVLSSTDALVLNNGLLTTRYRTPVADSVMSVPVGGAPALPASTWKTKSLVQALDTLLFPDLLPTYVIPTLLLSGTVPSGLVEVGSSVSQQLTLSASKNDTGGFTLLRLRRNGTQVAISNSPSATPSTDIADQYGQYDYNNPNYGYQLQFTDSFTPTEGSFAWTGESSYLSGVVKKNNKGVDDVRSFAVRSVDAPQLSSSNLGANGPTLQAIYPYYWGKSSSQPTPGSIAAALGSANKVLQLATGTIAMTFNASNEFIWFAIPSSVVDKTTWYNTALNQGSIGAGNLFLAPQTINFTTVLWNNVSYDVYISGYATSTTGSIQIS